MANKEFIQAIGSAALKYYPTYKILPSMTIAQACLESGWGKTGLAKDCNNYFGMKWTSSCGTDYKEYSTQEQDKNGKAYTISAKFRKYSDTAMEVRSAGHLPSRPHRKHYTR